jgi:hypothetical protein
MRRLLCAAAIGSSLALATIALAQSETAPPAATPVPVPVPTSTSAAAVPVASGKRFACKTAALALKGQDQLDQMQLCMMQARLDCLKQAIDQKIVGPERRDFVRTCAE